MGNYSLYKKLSLEQASSQAGSSIDYDSNVDFLFVILSIQQH